MIDFNNKTLIKLKEANVEEGIQVVADILVEDENVLAYFVSMRDSLVFTNKRLISVNVQGITGKKVDYTSIPYSKIQAFSIETAGTLDLDSELSVTVSVIGTIKFCLKDSSNIKALGRNIGKYILK